MFGWWLGKHKKTKLKVIVSSAVFFGVPFTLNNFTMDHIVSSGTQTPPRGSPMSSSYFGGTRRVKGTNGAPKKYKNNINLFKINMKKLIAILTQVRFFQIIATSINRTKSWFWITLYVLTDSQFVCQLVTETIDGFVDAYAYSIWSHINFPFRD